MRPSELQLQQDEDTVDEALTRPTDGDADGVAGRRIQDVGREAPLDPVAAAVAALVEGLDVRQRQLHSALRLVRPLGHQRRRRSLLVQVKVADVVSQENAAAEANSLPGREDSVGGQQGEGGSEKGTCSQDGAE